MTGSAMAWERHQLANSHQYLSEEVRLGPWSSASITTDPRHLVFVLSRYKFCAKMLQGLETVVEIACGDGIGIPVVAQAVKNLKVVDWDPQIIQNCKDRLSFAKNVEYHVLDVTKNSLAINADAAYSVDFLEHIEKANEDHFIKNAISMLNKDGILITGTPNRTASAYASKESEVAHVNLKSMPELRKLMKKYFKFVFMFGMNDEVIHTGFDAMCHYIWAVAAGPMTRESDDTVTLTNAFPSEDCFLSDPRRLNSLISRNN